MDEETARLIVQMAKERVVIGHNTMYLLAGFLCLFAVRYGEDEKEASQGPERSHLLPGSFAGVCLDFYGQLVEVARARREALLVMALLGKHGNGGFVWSARPGCAICVLGRHRKGAQQAAN
jgi:hypothetical protein